MIDGRMRQKHDIDQVAGNFPAAPQSEIITLELSPDLAAALDRFIERDRPEMSRAEAMAAAFREWATARGLVASADDGLRPEELNASNDG
jgi:hypothetical protein